MLVQSTLKIDFALSVMGGGGSRRAYLEYAVHMAAVLVACRWPWLTLAGRFLYQMGVQTALCLCRVSIFGTIGSSQLGKVFAGRRTLTAVSSLMSRCG